MKFLFTSLLFIVVSYGQYDDWGCNHYLSLPIGACIGSSLSAVSYTCNDTDTITQTTYGSYDDCDSTTDPTSSISVSVGSSSECDNSDDCGYFEILCDGVSSGILIMDVCYSSSSTSTEYTCSGSKVTTNAYTDSGDCSGSKTSVTIDYDTTVYDGCDFNCIGGGGSDAYNIYNNINILLLSIPFIIISTFLY